MKNFILITTGFAIAVVCYIIWQKIIDNRTQPIEVEHANYKVSMNSIASYFRTLGVIKGVDVPFISSTDNEKLKRIIIPDTPSDKKSIIVGVYNEQTEKVSHLKMIIADDIDSEIENALSKGFVVLQ